MLNATLITEETRWRIPAYAQPMLFVQGQTSPPLRTHGPRGEFTLSAPHIRADSFTLRWGTPDGPSLATFRLSDNPPAAHWDGLAVIGGAVGVFQVEEVHGLPLAIAHIEGAPVDRALVQRPTLQQMAAGFPEREETSTRAEDVFTYTVIAKADSPLSEYLFQAMAMDLGVVCTARLGPDAGRWQEISGLPLLVERLALFPAPNF